MVASTVERKKKAGLEFPTGRIARYMKNGKFAPRIGGESAIFMTAVLEYMVAEVMELSGKVALSEGKTRITPRHIQLATRNDEDFLKLLGNVTIGHGGVMNNIHDTN